MKPCSACETLGIGRYHAGTRTPDIVEVGERAAFDADLMNGMNELLMYFSEMVRQIHTTTPKRNRQAFRTDRAISALWSARKPNWCATKFAFVDLRFTWH
jgi:hypothetical protein